MGVLCRVSRCSGGRAWGCQIGMLFVVTASMQAEGMCFDCDLYCLVSLELSRRSCNKSSVFPLAKLSFTLDIQSNSSTVMLSTYIIQVLP